MEQSISTQIQSLEKQLQDSLSIKTEISEMNIIQSNRQNSQNSPKLQQIMKIVVNSLKLNEKLYNSIVQKEAKINLGINSFIDIGAQTDFKIQDVIKKTKQLYEDTVHQNKKSRFMLEQFLTPIKQQIKSKVDQTTFTLQMKMLLDEYDLMGHRISYDVTEDQKFKEEKRKSINSQTLNFLKDQILPVLSHIEQRLQNTAKNGSTMSEKIDKLNLKTDHLESELNIKTERLQKMQNKYLQLAKDTLNDQKIGNILRQNVRFAIKQYSTEIEETIEKMNRFSKNLQSTFTHQLQTLRNSLLTLNTHHKASQLSLKNQIENQQKKISEQQILLQKKNTEYLEIQNQLQSLHQNTHSLVNLQTKINDLQQKLEKGYFKDQNQFKGPQFHNLVKRLHDFERESRKIKQFQKVSEERVMMMKGQLQGIRDILSKKANFSDIVLHIESKVDRREFNELKKKYLKEKKDEEVEIKNNSLHKQKQREGKSSQKKRRIKSRSFFNPSVVQRQKDLPLDLQEVKRYQLGFNDEFLLSNDILKKQLSKTQYLRKSVLTNSSKTQKTSY